jgi:hypothetical protein
MVLAVVSDGVTPEPLTTIDGVMVPVHRIAEAPPPLLPVLKLVIVVPVPPVLAGKSILATGDTLPPVTVHPAEVRSTLTLA